MYPCCENHSQTGKVCPNRTTVFKSLKIPTFLLFFLLVAAALSGRAQTNIARNATVAISSGGKTQHNYGPEHFNDGVIGRYDTSHYAWVDTNGWMEYTWSAEQTIGYIKIYFADRPLRTCTVQYWSDSENKYIDLLHYVRPDGAQVHVVNLPEIVKTTKLRLASLRDGSVSPNFREVEVYNTTIAFGSYTMPSACNIADGTITVKGLNAGQTYTYSYLKDGVVQPDATFIADAMGLATMINLGGGSYTKLYIKDAVATYTLSTSIEFPVPKVNAIANQTVCSGGMSEAINFTLVNATSFFWTNNNTSIGLAASGNGNISSFKGKNITLEPVTATITVIAYDGLCAGPPMQFTITVDPIPQVSHVTVPANGVYGAGDKLGFIVVYPEAVVVQVGESAPYLELNLNSGTAKAHYITGSGTNSLLFEYTVQASDNDPDGISIKSYLDLNGTTFTTSNGCLAAGTLRNIPSTSGITIINQQPQTITFNELLEKTYGDTDFSAGAVASSALTVVYSSSNTAVATIIDGKVHITGAGTTIIAASQAGNEDYLPATAVQQTLTVNPRHIVVTAAEKSKTYGEADPALTYTYMPALVGSDVFSGALTREAGENVGAYGIKQGTLALSSNYSITYNGNNLTVTPKVITVAARERSKVYGQFDPVFTYTYDPELIGSDQFSGKLLRQTGENVGVYTIEQGTLALNSNYSITYVGNDFTITPKKVTVIADAKTKVYGDADPVFTYIVSPALVSGDQFTGSLSRAAGEHAGHYLIKQGTLALNDNYTLTYGAALLTIHPKAVAITADAKTKMYGDADPELTYSVSPALVSGDAFTGSLKRAAGENTGVYAVNQGTLALNDNYTLTYTGSNLTITPKPVTVNADAKTKVYGDADPALTYTFTPALVTGDAFSGALQRVAGENAGSYAINQGNLTVSVNYELTFSAATLVINKAVLTATSADETVCFGDPINPTAVSYSGFKYNDNFSSLSKVPVTKVPSFNRAGNYALTPAGGAAANYSFHYVSGQLTVLPTPAGSIAQVQSAPGVVSGYQLTAPMGASYQWSTSETTNAITVRASGNYSVIVTNPEGCSARFELPVKMQQVSIPNTFSPNGDGINDYWWIPELANYPSAYVTVINRDGQVVFESGNFTRWDGKNGGREVPAGVYFFRVRKAPGAETVTGWLNLVR
jgi:hypothetical protein